MTTLRSALLVLALSLPIAACDKGGTTNCPEPGPTPAAGEPVGALDREIVETAARGAIKMKVRTDATGTLVKQSVYHRDEAAIPKPVHELAAKKFPGGKLEYVESELYREHGRVYEIEVTTADGRKCEVAASAEGVELYEECVVDAASLPAPVTDAVAKLYPGAKVLEAETKKGPKMDEITVEVQVGEGEHYVRLQPDGTVIERLVRIPAVIEIPIE
jgi:hypothetical protein